MATQSARNYALDYPDSASKCNSVDPEGSAGAPEHKLAHEQGFDFSPLPGEAELPPEFGVVRNPPVNIVKKIIEIMRGYKTTPNYFSPVEVDRLDY